LSLKKIFVLSAFIICAGLAVAYYWFNQADKPEQDLVQQTLLNANDSNEAENLALESEVVEPTSSSTPQPKDYYVSVDSAEIRVQPSPTAPSEGTAYLGEHIEALGHQDDWIRIAPIYQLEDDGEQTSQWLPLDVVDDEPISMKSEQWAQAIISYIEKSDDFSQHDEAFIKATQLLLAEKQCRAHDFVEIGGWVKSINYEDDVYFTYCGGLETSDKIYLDVKTGKIFR
jgi:hypothetical protein